MTDKDLFALIREIYSSGWYELETGGTGAPGNLLENLLGLETSNTDTPDAGKWEIKFCSGAALLTLFHKTPRPREKQQNAIRHMINHFGWEGRNGLQNFRHTIAGKSDRGFEIVANAGSVWVKHRDHTEIVPHWKDDDILNAAGGKLRRLIIVNGEKSGRKVRYTAAHAYTEFRLSQFIQALEEGIVLVDFDAYIRENGSVRDHGTKFRIKPKDIHHLYRNQKVI